MPSIIHVLNNIVINLAKRGYGNAGVCVCVFSTKRYMETAGCDVCIVEKHHGCR